MAKFVTIGERLSVTAPTVNKAFAARDEEPILKRAKQQLDAGAVYLDVNIGPAENDGEDIMKWAVELLQSNFGWYLCIQPFQRKTDRKLCRCCRKNRVR